MARPFRDRGLLGGDSSNGGSAALRLSAMTVADLPSSSSAAPFGRLGVPLSAAELRETAYEIVVAACRATGGKPLTYIPQSERAAAGPDRSVSPSLQRSLTSAAASKMKKALGIRSMSTKGGSPGMEGGPAKASSKKQVSVSELMRLQMGISEQLDARIRRGLLRVAAGNLGKRVESMVLPLELLQQFKASDFPDQQEYECWKTRNLKVLEAGLLHHPFLPLDKSNAASQRLHQFMHEASNRPIETGKNSESMLVLYRTVMPLAYRSSDGFGSDTCHWADGFPFNLHLYQALLQSCFNSSSEEGSIIDDIDEVLELIKKTWTILGINQMFHNLCFTWILFHRFITTGQTELDLLFAADNQLTEVAKDAKLIQDPIYSKVLSSVLSSIRDWTEKGLLAYHDTFNPGNIEAMQIIVSLGITTAKILEDISNEYHCRRREGTDLAYSKIDAYIRSSLRTAFAQRMEHAHSSRRSSKYKSSPVLFILAKEIGDLASKEKQLFSPILKEWHPLAAGVAVATLHSCYRNELKQFISGVIELTPDVVEVLKAADKLEKDLVNIAVEDSVDSDDGGKSLIREMPPYEAESIIANLVRSWIKTRVHRLRESVDRNLQQEVWNPRANKESCASSSIDVVRMVDETLEAYFQLSIPMHSALLPDLLTGLDRNLQHYALKTKSGCGTRNCFMPALHPLTRCEVGSKLWKKKEKSQSMTKRRSQVGSTDGDNSLGLSQLCVCINSLYYLRKQLENLEKKIKTLLRNVELAQADGSNGLQNSFQLSLSACQEGILQLCETIAYKVIFQDLSHVLWDNLYVGETPTSRIGFFLKELEPTLEMISGTVHNRVRYRVITTLMKASFDGFLLVLLAGGPSRSFTRQESQILEEDFKALRDLYLADGDGLPADVVEKAAAEVNNVLPLFRADTESLIEQFKHMIMETYGTTAKSKYPLPQDPGHWSPTEPNTVLHVLCHRNDEAASKFLKKAYNLPKKL